jgi:hypothetical protein
VTTLVVDASVAFKWLVSEEGTDRAQALLGAAGSLLGPDIVYHEIASGLAKRCRSGVLSLERASEALALVARHFDELVPTRALAIRALGLSLELDHHLFDCIYLALAAEKRTTLVTADTQFVKKARAAGLGDFCVSLTEYTP